MARAAGSRRPDPTERKAIAKLREAGAEVSQEKFDTDLLCRVNVQFFDDKVNDAVLANLAELNACGGKPEVEENLGTKG